MFRLKVFNVAKGQKGLAERNKRTKYLNCMNVDVLEILNMKVVKRLFFVHGSTESFRPFENETVVLKITRMEVRRLELKSDEINMFWGIN